MAGSLTGLVVTGLILGTPYLVFGYHSPALHLVLDSVDACVALLLAYLLYGRFLRSRLLQHLLLTQGLLLLALASVLSALSPDVFDEARPRTFDVWLPLVVRVIASLLITAAALADRRARPQWHRAARWAPWLLTVAVFVILLLLRDHLPMAVDQSPPRSAQRPVITGHPALLAAQGFTALCFLIAAVAFTVQAVRRHDEMLRWLGPGCALAAFARINYVLFPSIYSDWVYTGDLLRTASYLLLLIGASREIQQYWSGQAGAAVLEDRRRLARELHDGVVQELGYIRAEARTIATHGPVVQRILGACERGLDEARAAIDALGHSADEPLGFVLHRAARQVAERYDAPLEVDLDDSLVANADQRHALVRITREAVSNAIRHGNAQHVSVRLTRDRQRAQLVVQDDGKGFCVTTVQSTATGYGLTSMRERAAGLPGCLAIDSTPGEGTKVAVTW